MPVPNADLAEEEITFVDSADHAKELCKSFKSAKRKRKPRKTPGRLFLTPSIEVPPELLVAQQKIIKDIFGGHAEWTKAANDGKIGTKHGLENIVGISIGQKKSKGKPTAQLCVVIEVLKKTDKAKVHRDFNIPAKIKVGTKYVLTDVQVGKRITPQSIVGGDWCGIDCVGAVSQKFEQGTIGVFCTVHAPGPRGCLLANSHVIGEYLNPNVENGTDILHESAVPGAGGQLIGHYFKSGSDGIDAALAFVTKDSDVDIHGHEGLEVISDTMDPFPGQSVMTFGALTGEVSIGQVAGFLTTKQVNYPNVGVRTLANVFVINNANENSPRFSSGGDSGSLVVDAATGSPVGLLIGSDGPEGSPNTVAQSINVILDDLDIVKILATR